MNVDSEIISLFPRPTCPKPKDFPIKNSLALYGTLMEEPLICGFSYSENECFTYQAKEVTWTKQPFAIIEERSHASSISYGKDLWMILGGQRYHEGTPIILSTSEILIDGVFIAGPALPMPLAGHCSAKIGEMEVLITGGHGEIQHLREAYILNMEVQPFWENITLMEFGKFGHACGRIRDSFNEIEIVTAGGLHQGSIERYSFKWNKWFSEPEIEDRMIYKASVVQGETTFIITGGVELEPHCTNSNCRLSSIHIYDSDMKIISKKDKQLAKGRGNHITIKLPEDDCSSNTSFFLIFSLVLLACFD